MATLRPGLLHTPVTTFNRDNAVDWQLYGKLIDFHLKHGAEGFALPMHAGESVSLTDEEQRKLVSFAVHRVGGKVPVIAHVSDSGTSIAASRAQHAEQAGAAGVIVTTPYYWTPPANMLFEHLEAVCKATKLPVFAWHAPEDMAGPKITTDIVLKLIDKRANFAGVIDSSNDWQWQINVLSNTKRVRSDFQLLCGTEYMISAGANGATGMISALAGVAPVLVRRLYDICRTEQYLEARKAQEAAAVMYQTLKRGGFGALKAAHRAMDRDVGEPRPPMESLKEEARGRFAAELERLEVLRAEPRGW
jgi:dihydrodipicolinate synthase/N-acetylneuraminate lyase